MAATALVTGGITFADAAVTSRDMFPVDWIREADARARARSQTELDAALLRLYVAELERYNAEHEADGFGGP